MRTHTDRAGLLAIDGAVDQLIDQLIEHRIAAAKMKAEFNAQIAELRRELIAQLDANTKKKWSRCKDNWPRPELSKLHDAFAKRERDETTRLN